MLTHELHPLQLAYPNCLSAAVRLLFQPSPLDPVPTGRSEAEGTVGAVREETQSSGRQEWIGQAKRWDQEGNKKGCMGHANGSQSANG